MSSEDGANDLKECQDTVNNNNDIDDSERPTDSSKKEPLPKEHFKIDALEHTKMAVAQFATTMAKGNDDKSVKDISLLQSTLFTLQHQQVFQMQLIEQLQAQLAQNSFQKDKRESNTNLKSKTIKDDENLPEENEKTFKNGFSESGLVKW